MGNVHRLTCHHVTTRKGQRAWLVWLVGKVVSVLNNHFNKHCIVFSLKRNSP